MTRTYRKALAVHALSQQWLARADAAHNLYTIQLQTAEQIAELETQARMAQGEQLKQLARLEIAKRLQDPSVTAVSPASEPAGHEPPGYDRPADK
jgi:hypothetical protein